MNQIDILKLILLHIPTYLQQTILKTTPLATMFQKPSAAEMSESACFWERVNDIYDQIEYLNRQALITITGYKVHKVKFKNPFQHMTNLQ